MNQQQLFTNITSGAIVLTPNRRLAVHLREKYHKNQQALGKAVWHSAKIMPVDAWLQQYWHECALSAPVSLPCLLNKHQTMLLWQNIIQRSSAYHHGMNITVIVNCAQRAWELLQQWQVKLDINTFTHNKDCLSFYHWAQAFQQHCAGRQWIDHASLASYLASFLPRQTLPQPQHLILACFDEITPQLSHLYQRLKTLGTRIDAYDQSIQARQINKAGCHDRDHELACMVNWAQQQQQAGITDLICVIPDLQQIRDRVAHVFQSQCESFNISLGSSLAAYPIIHTALKLLKPDAGYYPLAEISTLLRTPFIGGAEQEQMPRAQLDSAIHRTGSPALPLTAISTLAQQTSHHCPVLLQHLTAWQQHTPPQAQTASQWAHFFNQQLSKLGWPGERSLNSEEFQLLERWHHLLDEFASLDLVSQDLTHTQAFSLLTKLADNSIFQAQTKPAAINILGLLEAAGMTTDAMWVMGFDDRSWPGAVKPVPFIPANLQKAYNMPQSSAARELAFSQRLSKRLCHSALTVIISYPQQEQERKLYPSPLIADLPSLEMQGLIDSAVQSPYPLEHLSDWQGPAVTASETIQGGAAILKEQAVCPFRAFAKFRLEAMPLDQTQAGLNRLEQGILLHHALEKFWQITIDWQTLTNYDEKALHDVLTQSIKHAIEKLPFLRRKTIAALCLQLEEKRLLRLLTAWLTLEKQRDPFTVTALEHTLTLELSGINFKLRIDRIDKTSDGKTIIIDHKISICKPDDWFGERPEEPQLPLYSLSDDSVSTLLFAQIRIDAMGFKGFTDDAIKLQGVKSITADKTQADCHNWQSQRQYWHDILTTHAHAFCQGHAIIDPKHLEKTCQQCTLKSLCRIYDQT